MANQIIQSIKIIMNLLKNNFIERVKTMILKLRRNNNANAKISGDNFDDIALKLKMIKYIPDDTKNTREAIEAALLNNNFIMIEWRI